MKKIIAPLLLLFFAITLSACEVSQIRIIAQRELSDVLGIVEDEEGTIDITYPQIEFEGVFGGPRGLEDEEEYTDERIFFFITYVVDGNEQYAVGEYYRSYEVGESGDPDEEYHTVDFYDDEDAFENAKADALDELDGYVQTMEDIVEELERDNPAVELEMLRELDSFDDDDVDEYHRHSHDE